MRRLCPALLAFCLSGLWLLPLYLLASGTLRADDVPINGADKPVPQYSFAELSIKTEAGDRASWTVYPPPVKKVDDGAGKLYFGGKPGTTYTVSVVRVNFDKKTFDTGNVQVSFAGEQPDPDVDPDNPDGSASQTQLVRRLQAAADLEDDAEKANIRTLASLYRAMAAVVPGHTGTAAELYDRMVSEAASIKLTGHLQIVQRAAAKELKAVLPWKDADKNKPLTAGQRQGAARMFTNLANALDKVK